MSSNLRRSSHFLTFQEQEYLQKAKESLRFLDKIIARNEGWHEELRRSESNAVINSSRFDGIKGKVYKLEVSTTARFQKEVFHTKNYFVIPSTECSSRVYMSYEVEISQASFIVYICLFM